MLLGSYKYSLYNPHKLLWTLSQILPIASYILSNLDFPQKYLSHCYQIGPQNYTISTKKPKTIYLVGKIQKAQQNPLKSSSLYGNIFTKSYKAQKLFWHLFYKAKILFWHLFYKHKCYFGTYFTRPKYYFGTYFTKLKCYFGTYFIKPKYYFGTYFIKPKCYFGTYFLYQFYKARYYFGNYI